MGLSSNMIDVLIKEKRMPCEDGHTEGRKPCEDKGRHWH